MNEGQLEFKDILRARAFVSSTIAVTPLTLSPSLSEQVGREVYLKWDNKLKTGSFKERGAINFLNCLSKEDRAKGVCAASAGNHALALSYYAAKFGVDCQIVMPINAPLVKIEATEKTGARVILHGYSFDEAYNYALKLSEDTCSVFVSAFDDYRIMAGQGTCGLEILEQLEDFDSIIIPIGGGGLISGIASAIKEKKPDIFIMGVMSEWVVQMRQQKADAEKPLISPPTIGDGIGVKTIGKLTKPIIDKLVDKIVSVSELSMARAVVRLLETEKTVVEGSGAAALAALLDGCLPEKFKRTILLACGSNIDMNVLSRLIEREMGERGRILRISVSVPDRPGSLHAITGLIAKNGANVLQCFHDRSFSKLPGNVEISLLLEVRNKKHRADILSCLEDNMISVKEI
jgi:threonine dehydratase